MSIGDLNQKSGPRIVVPKPANDEHIQSYVNDGYLVMPNLIASAELEELKDEIVKLARGRYPVRDLPALSPDASDEQALQQILCIHQPHFFSPVILKYVKHPKICGVLSQIVGAHLPGWDGSVKCMQSMFFVKPPGFQGQAWHQDEIFIPTRDRSLAGAWIAVDDATIENGCMWCLPGSHRNGYLYPLGPHDNPDEFDGTDQSYGFDDLNEVPIEVKAGTVVFFQGYLLHRSRKNRGCRYRRVLVNHYMNAWSLLPWRLKDGESPSRADRRAIVSVAGIDPYAWKGLELDSEAASMRLCKANTPG